MFCAGGLDFAFGLLRLDQLFRLVFCCVLFVGIAFGFDLWICCVVIVYRFESGWV